MKRLEGKRYPNSRPLGMGNNEDSYKGTLLDRVTALENRLCQLCLDIESSTTTAFSQSGYASSSHESKSEPSSSTLPVFTVQKPHTHFRSKQSEIQEEPIYNVEEKIIRQVEDKPAPSNKTTGKPKSKEKKKGNLKWLPIRKLLGC